MTCEGSHDIGPDPPVREEMTMANNTHTPVQQRRTITRIATALAATIASSAVVVLGGGAASATSVPARAVVADGL